MPSTSTLASAFLLSGVAVAAFTTLEACPDAEPSVPACTVTAQHQSISTCFPTSTNCDAQATHGFGHPPFGHPPFGHPPSQSCSTEYSYSTWAWVSTVIPCAWDGKTISSCTVTKTDQDVLCSATATTMSTSTPTHTGYVTYTGTVSGSTGLSVSTTTAYSTSYKTISKQWVAPYNKLGPNAIPGYGGCELCKDCAPQEDGSSSQDYEVTECESSDNQTPTCNSYPEHRISSKPSSGSSSPATASATNSISTSVPSAGVYTFTFTNTAPASTITSGGQERTIPAQPWFHYETRSCNGPSHFDFTVTATTTIYYGAPAIISTGSSKTPVNPTNAMQWGNWNAPAQTTPVGGSSADEDNTDAVQSNSLGGPSAFKGFPGAPKDGSFYIPVNTGSGSKYSKAGNQFIGFPHGGDDAAVVSGKGKAAKFYWDSEGNLMFGGKYVSTVTSASYLVFELNSNKPSSGSKFSVSEDGAFHLPGSGFCTADNTLFITMSGSPNGCKPVSCNFNGYSPSTTSSSWSASTLAGSSWSNWASSSVSYTASPSTYSSALSTGTTYTSSSNAYTTSTGAYTSPSATYTTSTSTGLTSTFSTSTSSLTTNGPGSSSSTTSTGTNTLSTTTSNSLSSTVITGTTTLSTSTSTASTTGTSTITTGTSTSTTTSTATTSTTTTSPVCTNSFGATVNGFQIYCGYAIDVTPVVMAKRQYGNSAAFNSAFSACINSCAADALCVSADFVEATSLCTTYRAPNIRITPRIGTDAVIKVSALGSTTITSASTISSVSTTTSSLSTTSGSSSSTSSSTTSSISSSVTSSTSTVSTSTSTSTTGTSTSTTSTSTTTMTGTSSTTGTSTSSTTTSGTSSTTSTSSSSTTSTGISSTTSTSTSSTTGTVTSTSSTSTSSTTVTSSSSTTSTSTSTTSTSTLTTSSTSSSTDASSSTTTTSSSTLTTSTSTSTTGTVTSTTTSGGSGPTSSFAIQINTASSRLRRRADSFIGFVGNGAISTMDPNARASFTFNAGNIFLSGSTSVLGAPSATGSSQLMLYAPGDAGNALSAQFSANGGISYPGAGFCVAGINVNIYFGTAPAGCLLVTLSANSNPSSTTTTTTTSSTTTSTATTTTTADPSADLDADPTPTAAVRRRGGVLRAGKPYVY